MDNNTLLKHHYKFHLNSSNNFCIKQKNKYKKYQKFVLQYV